MALLSTDKVLAISSRQPLIDGLRGISVCLVVFGHIIPNVVLPGTQASGFLSASTWSERTAILAVILSGAVSRAGVDIFFTISGFLITHLLLNEETATGRISLMSFYIRRIFRILPAFSALILFVVALSAAGAFNLSHREVLMAASFQCNLPWSHCTWWLGHSWSPAVEEQFYLIWPMLLLLLGRGSRLHGTRTVAVGVLLASLAVPEARPFCSIAAGVLLAVDRRFLTAIQGLAAIRYSASLSLALIIAPAFTVRWPSAHLALLMVKPVCLAILFVAVAQGSGALSRIAAQPVVRKLGLASYSLYLWQQPFAGQAEYYSLPVSDGRVLLILPFALASYLVIERPLIALGRRMAATIARRSAPSTPPVSA